MEERRNGARGEEETAGERGRERERDGRWGCGVGVGGGGNGSTGEEKNGLDWRRRVSEKTSLGEDNLR
ncbi:hypothetical protein RHGRI_025630 [Rhododendron griersonianum]|uniref:Uncharacterized protein n=1 Tax=Rhododendron griersonianum TaxID=479676 RepID=A0AAV6ITC4_9ERIC|nr:hypothetical protein RHGRI_025630 [Rhododendron griersonianum]